MAAGAMSQRLVLEGRARGGRTGGPTGRWRGPYPASLPPQGWRTTRKPGSGSCRRWRSRRPGPRTSRRCGTRVRLSGTASRPGPRPRTHDPAPAGLGLSLASPVGPVPGPLLGPGRLRVGGGILEFPQPPEAGEAFGFRSSGSDREAKLPDGLDPLPPFRLQCHRAGCQVESRPLGVVSPR